jgi:hypothetical protein
MRKTSIETLQAYAISKGGKLISTEYKDNKQKLEWECGAPKHHRWPATWDSINHMNSWCPHCNKTARLDISVLQQHAISKGGKLISTIYINSNTNMVWECKNGCRWEACWDNIRAGKWCRFCNGKNKPDILELQQYASTKKGKLISTVYVNCKELLIWECKRKHHWNACWNNISNGNTWCPECASFKTEQKCREILEHELGVEFKKTRFIYNGNKYEFDGYNKENKIAFEYHGIQHYKFPNFWQETIEEHGAALERDRLKEEYCVLNNIKLLVIPYKEDKNLGNYVNKLMEECNVR